MAPRSPLLVVLAGATGLTACGGPATPPVPRPSPAGGLDRCPPPIVFRAGEVRPIRVRFDNVSGDTLTVFIDRCMHHTRLATVAPGRWTQVPLPDRLVAFPEGLRFHVYDETESRRVGTYVAPVVAEPILEVRLGEAEVVPDSALSRFRAAEGQGEVGDFAVSEEHGGYSAVWARTSAAILTWSCDDAGKRFVTLSTADKLAGDEAAVSLVAGAGRPEPVGRWPVQEGVTDALVVPDEAIADVTLRALEAVSLNIVIEDAEGRRTAHSFPTDDLRGALAGRACFAELLAG